MAQAIKSESIEVPRRKSEDDNVLKCGEVILVHNTQFSIACLFCQRLCEKIGDFYRHILYDHLNYLDDFESIEDDDPPAIDLKKETASDPCAPDDLSESQIEKIDEIEPFEEYTYIKSEAEEIDETEYIDSELLQKQQLIETVEGKDTTVRDILQIEILDTSQEADYSIDKFNGTSSELGTTDTNSTEKGSENEKDESQSEPKAKDKTFECPFCFKTFCLQASVKRHISNLHNPKLDQLSCDKCSKIFKSVAQLQLHVKRHLGVKPHSCYICGVCFSDKSNLNVHILRHKGIKPHKCTLCEKRFHSTTERKLHMRSHTGERPFICEVCGRKFSNSGHLCNHRRRHLGDKRFECEYCQKKFYDLKLLKEHKVVHSDERPFACDICGATFQRKKALLQHDKLHNSYKQYVCVICGKSFAQNAGLYSHMKCH